MSGRLLPVPRLAPLLSLATGLALLAPLPTPAQTTLLRQGAGSYAASGAYGLSLNRNWADLSFGLLLPGQASSRGARFTELQASFAGSAADQTVRLGYGRISRLALGPDRVLGLNAYVELGKQAGMPDLLGQASLGVEYEQAIAGVLQDWRLSFGSNLYLPFADYTAARFYTGAAVPRAGIDGYLAWQQSFGSGLDLGGRLSLFHYPASATRAARGLGTLSLTGRMTRALPEGSALEARLSTRFEPGNAPVPSLRLTYNHRIPHPGAGASAPVGPLRPASDCHVVPGARGPERISCAPPDYRPQSRPLQARGRTPPPALGLVVPAPQRHLGFGTLFTP
ncbi:MAG: hypothetical protein GYB53_08775 [Rhodobacteraceae bacterium]|nr:hypothetical protein [Paracoccaceae bacterium]MBR9820650.1 hypothetical protein [Paracoccaceae bacterium]